MLQRLGADANLLGSARVEREKARSVWNDPKGEQWIFAHVTRAAVDAEQSDSTQFRILT
jgi:hypothetical protein